MVEWFEYLTRLGPRAELSLGLLIALAVTLHVLRTKRDVSSAAAWIGLSWFAPFFGGIAYFMLGINRVSRRAVKLRASSGVRHPRTRGDQARAERLEHGLGPLQHGIGRITGRRLEGGNRIETLHSGDEAYPAMLAAIEAAQHSIGLSSYIFHADEIGTRFIEALSAAQVRGIAVRVIVDGIGGGWLRSPAYSRLRAAGVPAGRFMHSLMPWRMPFLNLRSHKKILVVDGRIGFTGGVNIADQNRIALDPADPVEDTHFRIEGPVVAQLVQAFARDWDFVSGEELDGAAWYPPLEPRGESLGRVITAGPDEDLEKIEYAVLQAIACARRRIEVMTPYFLPDQRVITALGLAAMRGVAVDIVIPQTGDHRILDWAVRANIDFLLRRGVRLWLCPPPFRHSKIMVIEGGWSLIGSSNWDMRSFRLNFELCVEVYDEPLAESLSALIERCRGVPITLETLRERPYLIMLRDAAARLLLPYL
ncbi:phospholipase D-like domain-containing protein [Acidisoma sp. C75]